MARKPKRLKKRPNWECTVYAIVDELDQIKYIGQTRSSASKRFAQHLMEPQCRVGRWIKSEIDAGRLPKVKTLTTRGVWDVSEIIWIERCRLAGCELMNTALGGKDKHRTHLISKPEAHYRRTGEITFM